jgi:SOS-response transcriptional repressor LexA
VSTAQWTGAEEVIEAHRPSWHDDQHRPSTGEHGRQQTRRIAAYVAKQQREEGLPPTVREIGKAVGLSSSSTVQVYLMKALSMGLLRHVPNSARSFRIPAEPGCCAACGRAFDE